jgi:GTPase SAR1 family protein
MSETRLPQTCPAAIDPLLFMTPRQLKDSIQRAREERFRILIIGNANAGKTTILQKVTNTHSRQPVVLDREGNQVSSTFSDVRWFVLMSRFPSPQIGADLKPTEKVRIR